MAIRAKVASKVASLMALAVLNEDLYSDEVELYIGATHTKSEKQEQYSQNKNGDWGYFKTGPILTRGVGYKDVLQMCPKGFKRATGIDMKRGDVKWVKITVKPTTAPKVVAKKKVAKRKK